MAERIDVESLPPPATVVNSDDRTPHSRSMAVGVMEGKSANPNRIPLAGMVDEAGMDEALAVSRVAMDQYKRIRQDYRQLLGRRAQNVVRTANAPATAKKVRALPFTRLIPIRRGSVYKPIVIAFHDDCQATDACSSSKKNMFTGTLATRDKTKGSHSRN